MSEAQEITVAAAQMQSQDNLSENLSVAAELVRKGARRGATLVVLPENFAFMGNEDEKRGIAEAIGGEASAEGPILSALRKMARDNSVFLIGGGMPERSIMWPAMSSSLASSASWGCDRPAQGRAASVTAGPHRRPWRPGR